jgi:hypothetical protein
MTAWYRAGGGVYCDASGPRIVNNIITRNRITARLAYGGGIEALGTSSFIPTIILEGNRISDNYAKSDTNWNNFSYSGGADLVGVESRVIGNVFERDTVIAYDGAAGGAMTIGSMNATPLVGGYIARNIFRSNIVVASHLGACAGGIVVDWTGPVTISDNIFESNVTISQGSWAKGGALLVDDYYISGYGRKMISGNRFANNAISCAVENDGGGYCCMALPPRFRGMFSRATVSRTEALAEGEESV